MADTLDALLAHLGTESKPSKLVVWAHNSHVGDARHTTMGESGEWNVGQLMRQRRPKETFLLGFTTYTGTTMAATGWDQSGQVRQVRPALPGSFAALFHATGVKNFLLPLRGEGDLVLSMGEPRLERAIGVVYVPQTERQSHYFEARMSKQFDAVIHIDESSAVKPLRP
jgi:erythromycin esterase-like protein